MNKNEELRLKFETEIKGKNCFLNPDESFTNDLIDGLLTNEQRYGYQSCPCRLAANDKEQDMDIICPCYYRDLDVAEFGNCYCALFISKEIAEGKAKAKSIPERRPSKRTKSYWLCTVCGDIHFGVLPPKLCPTCLIEDVYVAISKEEARSRL